MLCVPSPIMNFGRDPAVAGGRSQLASRDHGAPGGRALSFSVRSFCFAVFAVAVEKLSATRRAWRRLFGVQIRRPALRRVAVKPIAIRGAARQTSGDDIATHRLGFHDRDVGFAGDRDEIVGGVAAQRPSGPKMKWDRDLMHGLAVQLHRSNSPAHECARFDRAAQRHETNIIAIVDLDRRIADDPKGLASIRAMAGRVRRIFRRRKAKRNPCANAGEQSRIQNLWFVPGWN